MNYENKELTAHAHPVSTTVVCLYYNYAVPPLAKILCVHVLPEYLQCARGCLHFELKEFSTIDIIILCNNSLKHIILMIKYHCKYACC